MNFHRIIVIVFFILFFYSGCSGQSFQPTYVEVYDLNFKMKVDSLTKYPWRENVAYSPYTIPSYTHESDRSLFTKIYVEDFPFIDRLRTEYEQRILLPTNNENNARISLESKGRNIEKLFLIIEGIDAEEKNIFCDTLVYKPDTILSTVSKNIRLTNVELLNLKISAVGEKNKGASIVFSKLEIFLGDKSINEFPIKYVILPNGLKDNKDNVVEINLENNTGLDKIEITKENRIIGLAESIHGNPCIKNLSYKYILEQIESQDCKLIIAEMPFEQSLKYNKYIQDLNFELNETDINDPYIMNLLNPLRQYNSNRENKVYIFGMDYNNVMTTNQNTAIDIFDYIISYRNFINSKEIDELLLHLMDKDWNKAISFLNLKKDKIEKYMLSWEYKCISHILNLSKNIGMDGIERNQKRDSVMFINTKFLIDNFSNDKKVLIYGHSVHMNPVSTYPAVPSKPFGFYMKEEYPNEYKSLLILIGQGYTVAYDAKYNRIEKPLEAPPNNSIEYLLSSFEKDVLYIPLTQDFNKLILSRFKGSHHLSQEFYPFNLYQRHDGIFFIKSSTHRGNKENKKELSFEEARNRFLNKIKAREKLVNQIRKNINPN